MSQQSAVKSVVSRLLLAAVFVIAAWVSWSESKLAASVAATDEAIATLRYADVDTTPQGTALSKYVPGSRDISNDIRVARASAAYWLGRYADVAPDSKDSSADSEILLTAANAAYRDAQRDPGAGPAAVQKLDGVLQAYASALKASSRNADASYNYEYVARLRDQVARVHGKGLRPIAPLADVGDMPAGPTIHGTPGGPPPDAKMEELQTIAPMEYGDREAQPEATPGGKRERKG